MHFPFQSPTREVSSFELSDWLRGLERMGVPTPTLPPSNFMPEYVQTTEEGIEIYSHGGRTVEIHPGEVIDSHGNIVNLSRLQSAVPEIMMRTDTDEGPKEDEYTHLLLPTEPLPSEKATHKGKYDALLGIGTESREGEHDVFPGGKEVRILDLENNSHFEKRYGVSGAPCRDNYFG